MSEGPGSGSWSGTSEYSCVATWASWPSLTLTVHPKGDPEGQKLHFHGERCASNVEVVGLDRLVAPP